MINVMQGLGAKAQTLYLADSVDGRYPYTVLWRSIDRPQWDRPVIEEDMNNDNGSEVTKNVCGRTLTCLANLTYTDTKYVAEF